MKFKIILVIYFSTFFISCGVNKKVHGKYRSNFADLGFFITEIELKSDSTFNYVFSGDLIHTELYGNYKVLNKNLYLKFDKENGEIEKDVVKIIGNDTIVDFEKLNNSHNYELKKGKRNRISFEIQNFKK